jgi:hypothetical protein
MVMGTVAGFDGSDRLDNGLAPLFGQCRVGCLRCGPAVNSQWPGTAYEQPTFKAHVRFRADFVRFARGGLN